MIALAFTLALAAAAQPGAGTSVPRAQSVALKAGTVCLAERGRVLQDATILVEDGVIVAVGTDVEVPLGVRVVDYGADAVIAPGLIACNSMIGPGRPSGRTASPGVRAADNFDPYMDVWDQDLAAGITSLYLAPARQRLLAGQGAVVKLHGDERLLSESTGLHGSLGADARSVGGWWEPPVPATADVGLGVEQPQLPLTTMGAVLALRELIEEARAGGDSGEYGPGVPAEVAQHLRDESVWRLGAGTVAEIRGALELARSERLPLVIDGGAEAAQLAGEIKAAGASVIVTVDVAPGGPGRDFGKGRDARWPSYSAAAALEDAGVAFAIATPDNMRARDLRFAASVASRGGLSEAAALRAITIGAARILGVADRVGSITVGKDADFAVFNGPPMQLTSSVVATWVGGVEAYTPPVSARAGSGRSPAARTPVAVVIEAEELHLGDGEVLRPGQVLILDGKIAEVGQRVGRPFGAAVASGAVAMPGLVDAFGHLGLEGSDKTPDPDFHLARLVEPGDWTDRRVARAGVTTVVMAPRGTSRGGAPMMAYKPAASDLEAMVVEDPAALRVSWSDPRDRNKSGEDVRELLEKVVEYDTKWKEYEQAMSEWVPPAEGEAAAEEEAKDDGAEEPTGEDESSEAGEDEGNGNGKGKGKGKRKQGEEGDEQGDPLTGVWDGELVVPPAEEPSKLRLRVGNRSGRVTGTLRCDALSETLVVVAGSFEDGHVDLTGLGSRGYVRLVGDVKQGELEGSVTFGGEELELECERSSRDYVVAGRSEVRKEQQEETKEPKGKPKSPGVDEKLEPLRAALRGEKRVVVDVDRSDEILECVAAFEQAGIAPVLFGADDAWRVAGDLRGRVSGVLLRGGPVRGDERDGLAGWRNPYQELSAAGIPVAFHSGAEEGASELWIQAAYAVSLGLSPTVAMRALTSDSAAVMGIEGRVGALAPGLDGDVLLLDGPPLDASTSVERVWVAGEEVR